MRQLAALLSILIALPAGAAELWRWKDADGVVHYSDRPVQGAERIEVLSTQKTPGESSSPPPAYVPPPPPPPEVKYNSCVVTSPANDQVFFGVSAVNMAIAVDPFVQPGHRVQVLLNGRPDTDWPQGAMARTLLNAYRGTYTLSVRVLDANGRALCTGPMISFHVRQPSVLAPARKPPPKKP